MELLVVVEEIDRKRNQTEQTNPGAQRTNSRIFLNNNIIGVN